MSGQGDTIFNAGLHRRPRAMPQGKIVQSFDKTDEARASTSGHDAKAIAALASTQGLCAGSAGQWLAPPPPPVRPPPPASELPSAAAESPAAAAAAPAQWKPVGWRAPHVPPAATTPAKAGALASTQGDQGESMSDPRVAMGPIDGNLTIVFDQRTSHPSQVSSKRAHAECSNWRARGGALDVDLTTSACWAVGRLHRRT